MIDDHAGSRAVMCCALEVRGHVCLPVATEAAAVAAIDGFQPDIVILEWNLRDGTGRGIARRLRSRPGAGDYLIIVVSTVEEPPGFCEEEAVDAYFTKPVSVDALEAAFVR